jgi:hypothetical protein
VREDRSEQPCGPPRSRSYRLALRAAVAGGSKAYGFTLVIWTTAALTVSRHGIPGDGEAFAFLGGALAGMATIVIVSFGGWRARWSDVGLVRRAYGAIHLVSVIAAVLIGWLASTLLSGAPAFAVSSFAAVVVYNLLLALEVAVSIADVEEPQVKTPTIGDRARPVPDRAGGHG